MKVSIALLFFKYLPNWALGLYKAPKSQPPYWADARIHMFGNDNWLHANVAPFFTSALDMCVYNDNIRTHVCKTYLDPHVTTNSTILDIGCGTGMSTESLASTFEDSHVIGIDTSAQMLKVASRRLIKQKHFKNVKYELGNGHYYSLDNIDVSLISFMFHEAPRDARVSMLKRLSEAVETVAVLDISQDYSPSRQMLYGEPYLYDYLENIDTDMEHTFKFVSKYVLVPKHATLWLATNNKNVTI